MTMSATTLPPFDLDQATEELRRADPVMGAWIEKAGPCGLRVEPRPLLAALLRSITFQQLSGKAGATIHGRVVDLLGGEPTVEAIDGVTDEQLREAGLSAAKTRAVRDLAEHGRNGLLPDASELGRLPNEEITQRLTTVRGVGSWTAEMILIFTLGRPDVLPVTDLGIQKGHAALYETERHTPRELAEVGTTWKPWRSVASWYLWRVLDGPFP